jgi:hypothetical protein
MSTGTMPTAPSTARTFEVAASRRIAAPAPDAYRVFADYREAHPRVLPPDFFVGLRVESGGYGAGTVVEVEGRFGGRTRTMRGFVTEPEPGRLLVESYPADRTVTSFRVEPDSSGRTCRVTISSVFPRRRGPAGWIEERIVTRLLERVYAEELERVEKYLAGAL